jgi:ferredoxin--NADP+ reductase
VGAPKRIDDAHAMPDLNAVVTQRIDAASGLMILRVAPDGWPMPQFKSGQYVVLGLPGSAPRTALSDPETPPADPGKLIRRAYSIASTPLVKDELEFYVTLVRSGALTPRLWELHPGDRVWLSNKPVGMFTLDQVAPERNIIMIATGTGLAPYMSMLRTHLATPGDRRYAALVGARHSWDIAYASELMTMQRLTPRFTWLPTVSRPAEEPVKWGGDVGHVQDLWRSGKLAERWGFQPTPQDSDVFLCGAPGMIEEMTAMLGTEGFSADERGKLGQVHAEKYW